MAYCIDGISDLRTCSSRCDVTNALILRPDPLPLQLRDGQGRERRREATSSANGMSKDVGVASHRLSAAVGVQTYRKSIYTSLFA